MLRTLAADAFPVSAPSLAQDMPRHHAGHAGMNRHARAATAAPRAPTEPGQSAFADIQQIVEILEADPATDWSRVGIEALRRRLIDMNDVTLRAKVATGPVESGLRFTVTRSMHHQQHRLMIARGEHPHG